MLILQSSLSLTVESRSHNLILELKCIIFILHLHPCLQKQYYSVKEDKRSLKFSNTNSEMEIGHLAGKAWCTYSMGYTWWLKDFYKPQAGNIEGLVAHNLWIFACEWFYRKLLVRRKFGDEIIVKKLNTTLAQ
jgi:hypothetical protein